MTSEVKINVESNEGGKAIGSGFINDVNHKFIISIFILNIIMLLGIIYMGYIDYKQEIKLQHLEEKINAK